MSRGIDGFFTGLNVRVGAGGGKQLVATGVKQHHGCDVLVVAGSDRQGVAGHAIGDVQQFRGGVVHHSGEGHGSAFAQCIPVGVAFGIYVVFGARVSSATMRSPSSRSAIVQLMPIAIEVLTQ